MNQQQLRDAGYNISAVPWSVRAFLYEKNSPRMGSGVRCAWAAIVKVPDGASHTDRMRLAWQACMVHYVTSRLDGEVRT